MTEAFTPRYIGRFAPSPTGPVHMGTLVAAMASYLEARRNRGQWLLRIEDLDPPREVPGSANTIIATLDRLGFEWDGEIVYQSRRNAAYREAIDRLMDQQIAYACDCSRTRIARSIRGKTGEIRYPGTCRKRRLAAHGEVAIRVRTDNSPVAFKDRLQGNISINLLQQSGDFVIRRKDTLVAYQLAVVIDDACQGITEVVRGADLLDSTPRQIHLQNKLGLTTPGYAHIPLLLDSNGKKFSKSSYRGKPPENSLNSLLESWHHLNQVKVRAEHFEHIQDFWTWAVCNWNLNRVKKND